MQPAWRIVRAAVVIVMTVAVAACGGGGGGGGGMGGSGGGGGSGGLSQNPVLGATTFTTNENVPLSGTLTATDPNSGTVTFTLGTAPKSGTVSGFTAAGAFVYTPNQSFTGNDSFGVTATDTSGHSTTGTISITVNFDSPPTANSTIVRDDNPGAASGGINVLATANSPNGGKLTPTITTPATIGTAKVNGDGTIGISGLPGGFKGLTRFGYTLTDPSGKTASAYAVVFVGAAPFRITFVADSDPNGSGQYEVYMTDFAAAPVKETAATQGSVRLQGYAVANNGATIVYRSLDPANASSNSLSVVQTTSPGTQVPISLPSGVLPVADGNGNDQFVVSPDGKWVAVVAGTAANNSLYLVSVSNPSAAMLVSPTISGAPAAFASHPTFTPDSSALYFLAGGTGGQHKSIYLVSVSNTPSTVLVSMLSDPATSDDISAFTVASDQSTIVEQANRNGREGIWYVDAKALTSETEIDTPTTGVAVTSSTVGLPPGMGGSSNGKVVAYDVGVPGSAPTSTGLYVADVSNTPDPQLVAPLQSVIGFSPDNSKVLYTDSAQVSEIAAATGNTGTLLGVGNQAWYDSSGNIVLIQDPASSGSTLTYNTRPFGSPLPVTPAGSVAYAVDVSGFPQGVVTLGETSSGGAAPATVDLQFINVLAVDTQGVKPMYLASLTSTPSLQSPVQLTSYVSRVVTQ
ncbi:MAG TPA: Ig-like domain-containing protein [Steroidobacteraceae bacterium]|nr:Ig-like domain-containing protein [Steroidobacteraceae bacterium]